MRLRNVEMEMALRALEKHLPRRDLIGYAAARNTRILREESQEYFAYREELIRRYGEPVVEDGTETGEVQLAFDSPNWKDYEREMETYALIEHDVEIFEVPWSECIDKLTGEEMLEIDFMLRFG